MSRTVVLVSLGAAAPGEALLAGVRQLRADGAQVALVSRTAPVPGLDAEFDRRVPIGRPALLGVAGQRRIGKVVADPHRLPGAAQLLLTPAVRGLVRAADALVAVDAAALPAVWLAARVNRRAIAVNGLPAALNRLSSEPGVPGDR